MTDPRPLPPHHPHCLGCGPENPASLGLRLRIVGDRVLGEFTLDERHQGAPGFAHGGAVATALDDVLGSVLIVVGRPAVTARLELDYRRPAVIGRTFSAEGWLERMEGRKLHVLGVLRDEGEVIAEARALFVAVDADHFLAAEVPEGWRERWGSIIRERRLPY